MTILNKLAKYVAVFILSQYLMSCAYMLNEKTVEVAINSSPSGADIIINGRNYGQTPRTIRIEPSDHVVHLKKAGYGNATIKLETWQTLRSDKAEGRRCLADTLGTMFVLPAFSYWSIYCRDFKQKEYTVTLPYSGPSGSVPNGYYQRQNQNRYYDSSSIRRGSSYNQHNILGGGEYYENREYTDDSFNNPGSF